MLRNLASIAYGLVLLRVVRTCVYKLFSYTTGEYLTLTWVREFSTFVLYEADARDSSLR